MGWSVDDKQVAVQLIFKKRGRKVKLTHPESPYPTVLVQYEGDPVPMSTLSSIISLFPEFVYVHFVPNTPFSDEIQTGATLEPDRSNADASQRQSLDDADSGEDREQG